MAAKYSQQLLMLLVVQASAHILILRRSLLGPAEDHYNAAVAVMLGEFMKLTLSFIVVIYIEYRKSNNSAISSTASTFSEDKTSNGILGNVVWSIFSSPRDALLATVPALCYFIQNNLAFYAAKNLDAATFHVTNQLKILFTAFFAIVILKKPLDIFQKLSLLLLTVGVGLVNYKDDGSRAKEESVNRFIGIYALVLSCSLSGFAGVYWEKILKQSQVSMWIRNIQLSIFSLIIGVFVVAASPGEEDVGLFHGFNGYAWTSVVVGSFGGLLVSAVVKYADNILKCFATSISAILVTILSVIIFGDHLSGIFWLGLVFVISSIWIYQYENIKSNEDYKTLFQAMSHSNVKKLAGGFAAVLGITLILLPSNTYFTSRETNSSPSIDREEPIITPVDADVLLQITWNTMREEILNAIDEDEPGHPLSKFDNPSTRRVPSTPFISGDTFRSMANHIYDETSTSIDAQFVKEGDVIFVKTDLIKQFFEVILPQIDCKIILITHNSDYSIPGSLTSYVDSPKFIAWFGQNLDTEVRPPLIPIPIGLANRYWDHGNLDLFVEKARSSKGYKEREIFVYANFGMTTSSRAKIQEAIQKIPNSLVVTSRIPISQYLDDLTKAKFVVSPIGNGLDCHRTWEALIMGAIPIVMKSTLNPLYEDLPVLVVENYENLTAEFLNDYLHSLPEKFKQGTNLQKVLARYWREKIIIMQGQAWEKRKI